MTSPLDFLYSKPQQDTSPAKPTITKGDSSLDFLYNPQNQDQDSPQVSGFSNYISNVFKHANDFQLGLQAGQNVGTFFDNLLFHPERNAADPAFQQASSDLIHVYKPILDLIGTGDPTSIAAN